MSKVIAVTFNGTDGYQGRSPSTKRYHYRCDVQALAVGDTCTVMSPSGLSFVTVVDLDPSPSAYKGATKWIISKVDLEEQRRREARDAELARVRDRVEAIRDQFLEAERLAYERERFARIACTVPGMGDAYHELVALQRMLAANG